MVEFSRASVTAVLGPTNTGKTHLAVERLCAHSSGMMGFPLRLLAREVYDRVVAIKGEGRVERIVLGRNELVTDANGRVSANDTGEREELPVQLVVRSVGYRGVPTPGLPFDEKTATIPNSGGRVDGSRNEYVVGWIKRGPTGVIGTNKKDSQDTVDTLLADLASVAPPMAAAWRISRTTTPTSWPNGWPRASPNWSPRRIGSSSTPTSGRPASRTGAPASSCRAWPSCFGSATARLGSCGATNR